MNTLTGQAIAPAVQVQVVDPFGNLVSSDSSTVTVAIGSNPGGGRLSGSASALVGGGFATFSGLSVNNAGNGYTLVATDGSLTRATSNPFNAVPLQVVAGSFTPNATGFSAQFNRPINPAVLNLYNAGSATIGTSPDVTLTGINYTLTHSDAPLISGTLFVNPATNTITFVQSGGVLPSDTYTVTFRSASDGFTDTTPDGGLLDGNSDGTPGDNFVTTFTVAASTTPVLSIADFARGPNGSAPIKVPINTGAGIPLTLTKANNVSDATFTLTYNPALLAISGTQNGPTAGSFTLLGNDSVGGVAMRLSFNRCHATERYGTLGPVGLRWFPEQRRQFLQGQGRADLGRRVAQRQPQPDDGVGQWRRSGGLLRRHVRRRHVRQLG